jgi:rhodanese-related sulfurtransferase
MVWGALFFLLIFSYVSQFMSPFKVVNTHDMTLMVNRENAHVVDIRAANEFAKGHIAGAENLPLAQITAGKMGSLEKKKDTPIVVICNAGISAKTAASSLMKSGFSNVAVLQGGMNSWLGASLPVVKK